MLIILVGVSFLRITLHIHYSQLSAPEG